MKKIFLLLFFLILSHSLYAKKIARVGIYHFPPFVETTEQGPRGITLELIKLFNSVQDNYVFEPVLVSPRKRYAEYHADNYDLLMFESMDWGWTAHGIPLQQTEVILTGGEIYFTLKSKKFDQSYFESFKGKPLAGVLGYHYGFADFISDPDFLKTNFKISLMNSQPEIIDFVNDREGGIGIITHSYLMTFLSRNPKLVDRYLISDKFDQRYQHRILIKENFRPNAEDITDILHRLQQSGQLQAFWQKYGLASQMVKIPDSTKNR